MGIIPTYTRQSGIPSTTGVSAAPVVTINNQVAQATGNFFQRMGKVGDKLFAAQASSELTTATTNAQLKLVQLESDLAKQPGISALGAFEVRAAQIYNDVTKTMHPDTRLEFDKKWGLLSAKTQTSIQDTATKRAYSQMAADVITNLDALAKGIGPNGSKVDGSFATTTGIDAINLAVSKNVFMPKEGAKLKKKFVQDVAENGVTGWINRQTQGTMMSAFVQMDTEKFADLEISKMWSVLDEDKKATLTAKAITNLRNMLSFEDKEKTRKNKVLASNAKGLMLEFYGPETTKTRRTAILTELSKNKTVQIGTYNTMLKDNEGRSDRFDDQKKSTKLQLRILRTPHLVTSDEIIKYGGSDVGALLAMHATKLDARTKRAREIVKSSPEFVPSNMAEARIKGEVFDAAQAEIWNQVLVEQTEARDKGEKFDPVKRAKELIKEFKDEQDKSGVTRNSALSTLSSMGIYSQQNLDKYIATKKLSFKEQNRLRGLAGKAFR